MKIAGGALLFFGFLNIVAGTLAFMNSTSSAPVLAGFMVGLVLLALGGLALTGRVAAGYLGGAVTFFMAIYFAYRFIVTERFVPSAVLLLLAFFVLFLVILGVFLGLREER